MEPVTEENTEEGEQPVRRKSSSDRRFSFNPVIERLQSFQRRLSLGLSSQEREDDAAVAAAAVRMHERREKVRSELVSLCSFCFRWCRNGCGKI